MKPLGRKAYGSIGHLPSSRIGPGDHFVHAGQAAICTQKARDRFDRIIVQEKLDGSCTAVAKVGGEIVALGRAGYLAETSKFEQHHLFAAWVYGQHDRFAELLHEGERVVGEWLAQAHGTIYTLGDGDPWRAFDIMVGAKRAPFDSVRARLITAGINMPMLLSDGPPISTASAMELHALCHSGCDEIEGVVYRVERSAVVDFLAKFVRLDKQDGKYLPELNGGVSIWNWHPQYGGHTP